MYLQLGWNDFPELVEQSKASALKLLFWVETCHRAPCHQLFFQALKSRAPWRENQAKLVPGTDKQMEYYILPLKISNFLRLILTLLEVCWDNLLEAINIKGS